MPRDYRETVRALRAKANDPVVGPEERTALLEKAAEMEEAHGLKDDTVKPLREEPTITDRSGHSAGFNIDEWWSEWWKFQQDTHHVYHGQTRSGKSSFTYRGKTYSTEYDFNKARYDDAQRQTEDLFQRQHAWNKPPDEPDPDNLVSEEYKSNDFDYENGDPYDA